jgi:hypothetical protein
MPVKKCKYCKTRMSKVVWGMTSQQDYESADEFTEFRGCVITSPTETWRCDFCDAKIIPSHTPKSGVCIEEAPKQLINALEIFASRINQIADNHHHPDSERRSLVASLVCNGEDYFSNPSFLSRLPHLTDEEMLGVLIPEPFNEHESKGDYLSVTVCPNLELRFFFEGTGELVAQTAASKLKPGTARDLYDFASPEFSNMENQLEDLLAGSNLLLAVVERIINTQDTCDAELCNHPEIGAWEDLQELREKLGHKYARLNSELPSLPSTSSLERQMI